MTDPMTCSPYLTQPFMTLAEARGKLAAKLAGNRHLPERAARLRIGWARATGCAARVSIVSWQCAANPQSC
jgi:hypothetical protein